MHDPDGWNTVRHRPQINGWASRGICGSTSNQKPLSLLKQPHYIDGKTVCMASRLRRMTRGTGAVLDAGTVIGTQGKQAIFGHD
jgi:hypothetical protein